MKRWLGIAVLAGAAAMVNAQTATQIITQTARNYAQLRSLRAESQVTVQISASVEGSEMRFTSHATQRLQVMRPNFVRLESQAPEIAYTIANIYCDGKHLYIQHNMLKQTIQQPAPRSLREILEMELLANMERLPVGLGPLYLMVHGDWRRVATSPKLVRRERLGSRAVYKLTMQVRAPNTPSLANAKGTQTLWIGVQDRLIWKSVTVLRATQSGLPFTITFTETISRQEANPKLQPAMFAYVLPQGYEYVKEFKYDAPTFEAAEALKGKPASDFALKSLEGKEVRLSEYKGKVVVLNIFAHWCGPCRREAPELEKDIWQAYRERGVVVLGVATWAQDNPQQRAEEFAREFKLSFPVLVDANNQVATQYQVSGVPTTLVIDKEGIIREVIVGVDMPKLKQAIEALLQ